MPSVKLLPDSDAPFEPSVPQASASQPHSHFAPRSIHIFLGFAALLVIILARFAIARFSNHLPSWTRGFGQLERRQPNFRKDFKSYFRVPSAPDPTSSRPFYHPSFEKQAQTVWAAGLLASTPSAPRMEEQPDQTGSRGVSTSAAGSVHHIPAAPASRKASRSPRSHNSRSSSRTHSNSSDGSAKAKRKGKGKALVDGDSWGGSFSEETVLGFPLDQDSSAGSSGDGGKGEYQQEPTSATPRFSRPIPPPPLTPPTLSASMFAFQDRRPNYAVSIPPQLDTSFIHQPNPDYMASSTSAEYYHTASPKSASGTPRRRSYTKSGPIGVPLSTDSSSSPSQQSQAVTSGASPSEAFSPSSYPPSSPQLPPPPPGFYEQVIYDYEAQQEGEIDLQGEIISVTDDAGHSWKRHTRVYGGGVCLACVAAGEREGGFYGDKVPLSERR